MRLLLSLGPQITQIPEVASVDLLGGCWCGGGLIFLNQVTPRKTNMSPENQWLEDVFPIKILPSYGTC